MAKETTKTAPGTIGELAPAAERVALGAPATAAEPAIGGTASAGSIAEAAALLDAPEVLREMPGPGVGAERVAERIDMVRDRSIDDVARQTRFLPGVALVNPEDVSGRRWVDVATRVTHDGLDYTPDHADPSRRSMLVDFKQYSELAAIGAVIPLSPREVRFWADDED